MPKVNSYAPAWLYRPSPGANLFASNPEKTSTDDSLKQSKNTTADGPVKTIAKRANEVFAVVDNEIRWSNLARLKDQWQQQERQKKTKTQADESSAPSYRVLAVPVYGRIKQILPSPNGAFLAIVAENTVHIAVLPDSSHLSSPDKAPIRLKTYQLGPTTHVLPQAPVVSALWHPLGLHTNLGGCLVTITADAAVRVWELDRNNHWSFDQPTLAVDLQKLVDGTSSEQDFAPSGFGKNKGFSADVIDMEVASACFAGNGNDKENAWAPMTLWIAMKPGDLYALCPLLPSKWQAPSATIPSLSSAIIPKLSALEEAPEDVEEELIAARQQYEWLKEIDEQEPAHLSTDSNLIPGADVFSRPSNPSPIPRLQGPFRFETGDELDDLDLRDILVIASKLDAEDLMAGEDDESAANSNDQDKLSATVVCLTNGNGRVHICLELDGVEGQWLPRSKKGAFRTPISEPADLVLVESLDTIRSTGAEPTTWPTFTKDVHSPYSFFVTTASNVVHFSLASWVQRLESELQAEDTSGSGFRLQILCSGNVVQREKILQASDADVAASSDHLATSLVFYDFDLGYMLLTSLPSNPYAAVMDGPEDAFSATMELRTYDYKASADASSTPLPPHRAPYQVPAIFYAKSPLETFVEKHVPHRQRHTLKEQVRLSPATLDLVTTAHRVLSAHTNALERAASDLFRRCERLQGEMKDQLKQLSDVAERIQGVASEIGEDGNRKQGSRNGDALDKRLQAAKDKQDEITRRYEALRKKLLNSGGRPLSQREKAWISEVKSLNASIDEEEPETNETHEQLKQRLETVKNLANELVAEAKNLSAKASSPEPGSPASPGGAQPKVPQRLQRAKVADAMRMVERESAVIEAITSRLERLHTSL
ncbi:Nucleoporin NUP82 [Penicillium diatomitis]|uniref:Nucleoporin NUP82 n=1 Tax=Penicillium diatomitis TaxID=2819901 RepID=A0A9X0BV37_9EURO|nr:Nucleoporin NUP82 [Penicillium diatomitis]KAJ5485491.1 Nucleoporin NUP82 [Penicillium diatomitis]